MVGYQVMVIASPTTTPVTAIAMGTLGVTGIVQALRSDAPLYGYILRTVDRQALVDAPRNRTVINDDVF